MKRPVLMITVLCVLCASAAVPALAQSAAPAATVTYVDGQAAVHRAAGWVDLSVGDGLASDARLRLFKEAYVELDASGARIVLSRPGGYALSALLSTNTALNAARVGASLSTALARMVKGSVVKQSAVMGVLGKRMPARGEEPAPAAAAPPFAAAERPVAPAESPAEPSSPIRNDTQEKLEMGKLLIAAGEYTLAIDSLMDALGSASASGSASDDKTPEIRYYLACARSLSGDTHGALKLIEDLEAPKVAGWTLDYAIFKAKMLAESNAFSEEIAWLSPFGPALSKDPDRAAMYYFLLGVGYRGTGNAKLAWQNLSTVVSLSGKSEIGAAAEKLLKMQ